MTQRKTRRRKRRFTNLTRSHVMHLATGCCLLRGDWGFGDDKKAAHEAMREAWQDASVRTAVRQYWLEKWAPGGKRGEKLCWAERTFGKPDENAYNKAN